MSNAEKEEQPLNAGRFFNRLLGKTGEREETEAATGVNTQGLHITIALPNETKGEILKRPLTPL
ncbi:MAG: hypothetical protein ACT4OY_01995, partial [Alphaproteobacteria bacterium]